MNPQDNKDLLRAFPSNVREDALAVISVLPENQYGANHFEVQVNREMNQDSISRLPQPLIDSPSQTQQSAEALGQLCLDPAQGRLCSPKPPGPDHWFQPAVGTSVLDSASG